MKLADRRPTGTTLRVLGALLLFVATLGGASPAPAETEHFAVGLTAAPVTLDPRYATDATSHRIVRLLYGAPAGFDEQQQPVPGAMHWRQLDERRWRFTLQPDQTFSDGTAVTAADFAATYESVLAEASASPHRAGLSHIETITVVDAQTVDLSLSRPDPLLPGRLLVGILPAAVARSGERVQTPLGSGPFRFVAWPNEQRLVLERRGDGAQFEFLVVKDPTVRVLKLARGEVDILPDGVSFDLLDWMRAQGTMTIVDAGGTTFSYLGVNFEDPLTGDPRIREALALAVDREAIVTHLFLGRGRPGVSLLPPAHWASDPTVTPWPFDPERARALVAEVAAERGAPVTLTYKTSANPFRLRLATILKSQFEAVGIGIEIRSYDWGTFYADVKAGRFQLYALSWVGLKLPDIYRYVFHSEATPPAGANRGRYVNARVDELIEQAEAKSTVADQIPLWQALQRLVHADLAYIPLWYEDRVAAVASSVAGFTLPADGNWDALATVQRVEGSE